MRRSKLLESARASRLAEAMYKRDIGSFCMFMSGVCFALGGLCMKFIPWQPLAINCARNIIGSLFMGAFLIVTKHRLVVNRKVIFGALCIFVTMSLYTFANKLTTAGNAIILQFTSPIWVMVISSVLYKKKPTKLDILAAVFVFAGVICFFIDGLSAGNMLGNLLALLSGVTYVGVFMMAASKDSDSLSSTFFGMALNVIIGFPFLLRTDVAAASKETWIALIVLGVFQQGCAYIFLNKGLKTTPPITASLIGGIEPVLNPVLVAIFYGETLTSLSLFGAVIVFVSILTYNVLIVKQSAAAETDKGEI